MKVDPDLVKNGQKLLVATRVYGAEGQPWMRRQVEGVRSWTRHLICWKHQRQPGQEQEQIGLDALAYPPAPYDGNGRWWHRLKSFPGCNLYASQGAERRELEMILRRERPSVLLCYFGDIAMRLLPTAMKCGVPVVAYLHGDFQFLSNRWYRLSLLRALRKFSAIVTVTEKERLWIKEKMASNGHIHVIPCGAPTDIFKPCRSRTAPPPRFAIASRLALEKGCHISLRAFAALHAAYPGAKLEVFGDGPARADLAELAVALGVQAHVAFHGYVCEAELARRLPDCDVFLQHSLGKEGSPVSIAEAMSCALPIVATPVGGIVEQVVHGRTGFLVEQRDLSGMVHAMRMLADSASLRNRLGEAGRQRALSSFDASKLTQRLEEVVRNAAAPGTAMH